VDVVTIIPVSFLSCVLIHLSSLIGVAVLAPSAPVFPDQTFPPTKSSGWTIERPRCNRWVVQGNLDVERRSYNQLFADMLAFIEGEQTPFIPNVLNTLLPFTHLRRDTEDPASWGLIKPPGEVQFVPIEGADNSISLHVIGKRMIGQEPTIPPELEGIIEIYENLNFTAFYDLLHSMVSPGETPFYRSTILSILTGAFSRYAFYRTL
jgi:hypothetical protein